MPSNNGNKREYYKKYTDNYQDDDYGIDDYDSDDYDDYDDYDSDDYDDYDDYDSDDYDDYYDDYDDYYDDYYGDYDAEGGFFGFFTKKRLWIISGIFAGLILIIMICIAVFTDGQKTNDGATVNAQGTPAPTKSPVVVNKNDKGENVSASLNVTVVPGYVRPDSSEGYVGSSGDGGGSTIVDNPEITIPPEETPTPTPEDENPEVTVTPEATLTPEITEEVTVTPEATVTPEGVTEEATPTPEVTVTPEGGGEITPTSPPEATPTPEVLPTETPIPVESTPTPAEEIPLE